MQFDLSASEVDLLVGLLDSQVGKKLVEIRRTDNRDFKHDLQHEELVLEGLLGKLKQLQAERWKAAGFR
jgi:hypothetical protein